MPRIPQRLKPCSLCRPLRGAEAPLFHGTARVLLVLWEINVRINVKSNVKGVGRECPTHTSNLRSPGICTGLFFLMFR
jgi:hypothetical protein